MRDFITQNGAQLMLAGLVGGLLVMMVLEMAAPRRPEPGNLVYRWSNNLFLTFTNYLFLGWVGAGIGMATGWWAETRGLGLLNGYGIGPIASTAALLLAVECLSYFLHRAFHRFPTLWRIHAVHHSDVGVDVTTSHRHHPFEGLVFMLASIPLILLLGPPVEAVVTYNLLRTAVSLFSHANLYLPEKVDAVLRRMIVTPDFHRLHHASERRYTDSNYSVILPWFDYLFGTASRRRFDGQVTMELGLRDFRRPADSRFDRLLLMPFVWNKTYSTPGSQPRPRDSG